MTAGRDGLQSATTHVIVTCTNRKSLPIPARLRLASVPDGTITRRARIWISRLTGHRGGRPVAARELYAGEHWVAARSMTGLSAGGAKVRLWACSAGYGLIPASALIHPYAATFAAGHPDSAPGGDEAAHWWRALSEWDGPAPRQPRSLRALIDADPAAVFILALSQPYLRACRADILDACERVTDPGRFMVVSAGTRNPGNLGPVMVPADARLQACLGGTRQALNARIAAHLLSAGIQRRDDAVEHLTALLHRQAPLPTYDRKKLSDQEILDLIALYLTRSPAASPSRLLREFRDAGYACEQRRFSQLYRRLTGATP
jgi:hypothetical protein